MEVRTHRLNEAFYFQKFHMKELPDAFIGKGQVRGFKFTQVKKTEFGYIYKVECFDRVWYESFKRKENSRFGVVSYPTNKSFGVWAITTSCLERAEEYLNNLEISADLNNLG